MTSVTNAKCLESMNWLDEVLCRLSLFDGRSPAPNDPVRQAVSISLKETLAGLQSADLETVATMLRNVVGQIDALLLERQLAECGFDAVRAVPYSARYPSFSVPPDAPTLSNPTASA
jgi:hypothetical protein